MADSQHPRLYPTTYGAIGEYESEEQHRGGEVGREGSGGVGRNGEEVGGWGKRIGEEDGLVGTERKMRGWLNVISMHSIGIGARYDHSFCFSRYFFGRRSSFCTAQGGSIIIYNGYERANVAAGAREGIGVTGAWKGGSREGGDFVVVVYS